MSAGPSDADDLDLACELAAGCARVLMALRACVDTGEFSSDPVELQAAGDDRSQTYLAESFARLRPGDRILSEQATDDLRRRMSDRVWIIDPLDGTREFAERDVDGRWRDDFAVHLALWRAGHGLTAAAVALPAQDRVHASGLGRAADIALVAPVLSGARPMRVAVSRSRPPVLAEHLAHRDGVELVPMGSCGAKVIAVTDGIVDAYVHAGGQYEWDSAAPVAVALAAGFIATRLDGSPLVYNQADPWSPDLIVCHPALAGLLTRHLAMAALDAAEGAPA